MKGIHRVTSQVIDYAERVADMADAAQGKHRRSGGKARWLFLPASGAAMYALLRSDSLSRQAKGVIDDAKARASELPEDLVTLVRETVDGSGQARRQTPPPRKRGSARKTAARKTTTRKTTSASR